MCDRERAFYYSLAASSKLFKMFSEQKAGDFELLDQKQDDALVSESSMVNLDVSFDCRFPLIVAESMRL